MLFRKARKTTLQLTETRYFLSAIGWTKAKIVCMDTDCLCGFLSISYRVALTKRNPQSQLFKKRA